MVTRVFVEKRKGFDVEARHMMADLRQNLGIKAIEELRILNRYDVSGLSGAEFEAAARTILSEPNVDNVYGEDYAVGADYKVFATEYLPGQYDQRADSASQCVQLLTQGERPQVAYAKVIAVKGDLTEAEMDRIKGYIVNPVESRLASMEKPESLDMKIDYPADVKRVTGMIAWSEEELKAYYGTMGFAMTLEDLAFCRDYFRDEEHRDPTVTELRVIDTYWSDHCRHTTFLTRLNNIEIEKGRLSGAIEKALGEYFAAREELYAGRNKPVSLMDMATIGTKYLKKHGMVDNLDESDEINACSIEVPVEIDGKTEQWLVQFKNETHNHPTEIEPFGGAATCLGGATGRDGCGGATGSSKAHTLESIEVCGAEVQKGNPPTERKIQRLFRNPAVSTLIKRCNDFGAGGVCVAIGELAPGLEIDLNKVPKKYEGLDGTELAISESQERMAVVLDPKDVDAFRAAAQEENLDAQVVAVVTAEPRLKMEWRGDRVVDLSRAFLDTNGVTQNADAFIAAPDETKNYRNAVPACLAGKPLDEAFCENLARLEVCGQKGLSERFDASIGAGTVLMPFAGKYQLTPEDAMVAKIPLLSGETDDATAMAYGYIPGIARFSPFHGAAYAVVESLSKLAAVGADPMQARLTFQEYFERLHDKPERWGKPAAALLGALTAQLNLGLPSIGGKDSMSGSFEDLDVPPTLVSFAVTMTTASGTVSGAFKYAGNSAVLLPIPEDEETGLPNWEALKAFYGDVLALIEDGAIVSAHVVKEGGAAAAVAKMAFGNKMGFVFNTDAEDPALLFAPKAGALVVEVEQAALRDVTENLNCVVLGMINESGKIEIGCKALGVDDLIETWNGKLEKIFANKAETVAVEYDVPLQNEKYTGSPVIKTAKPKVFIPVFPGTNCEIDTKRAFEKAGAETEILVVQNLTAKDIEYTIDRMEKAIRSSQIIMIPGGFSGGDEPEGSGKFIATTFRNPKIAQAVTDLLESRDGLMLGICNGFQALIKLGLVTYGKIVDLKDNDPTLTFNTLGRHVSRMVYTRVTNTKSPWLSGVNAGDVFAIPVSHGEGRFVADDAALRRLIENGQIATQYTTPCGKVSGDITWNPNGSVCGIEGITSPDGRVFGKMGHSERKGDNLYFNVPGEKDQQIFESGVRYFK